MEKAMSQLAVVVALVLACPSASSRTYKKAVADEMMKREIMHGSIEEEMVKREVMHASSEEEKTYEEWHVPKFTGQEIKHEYELLDALLEGITAAIHEKHATPETLKKVPYLENRAWEGNSHIGNRPAQAHSYFDLIQKTKPKRMCEIGFNGGHSAAVMLAAGGRESILQMFDLHQQVYSTTATNLVSQMYPRQFNMIAGDSTKTVPEFTRAHGRVCDLFSVDGDHRFAGCKQDILNAVNASKPGATIILDDMLPTQESRHAFDDVVAAGLLKEVSCTPYVPFKIPYKDRFDYDGPHRDLRGMWCRAKVPET